MNKNLILGRVEVPHPSFLKAGLNLLNPGVSSRRSCREFMAALWGKRWLTPLVRCPPNTVHSVFFCPTGYGKSVSFILPFMLTCDESMIVLDFKGELFKETAAARERMGHEVIAIDPFKLVTRQPHKLNPLSMIDPDSPNAIDEIKVIAESWIVKTPGEIDPHWSASAELFLGAAIAFVVCFCPKHLRNLQSVREILTDSDGLNKAIKKMQLSEHWNGILARWGSQLLQPSEKERGSILSTLNRNLSALDSLAIAESTSESTFKPEEISKRKMTIFLIIPVEKISTMPGVLRMWLSTILLSVVKGEQQEKNRIHVILDEVASLGSGMRILNDLVDKFRAWSFRAYFFLQSAGQLKTLFPIDGGQTLLSNASATVYLAVNDTTTAEEVSKRCGDQTVVLESGGSNTGRSVSRPDWGPSTQGGSSGQSTGWQQSARRLIKLEEILGLNPRTGIAFFPGMKPVIFTTIRHHEENFMPPSRFSKAVASFKLLIGSLVVLAATAILFCQVMDLTKPKPPPPPEKINFFGRK